MEYIEHLLTKEYIGGMSIVEENTFRITVVLFSNDYYVGSLCSEPKIPFPIIRNLVEPGCAGSEPIILHGCSLLLLVSETISVIPEVLQYL
jgi:hypothetical protein